MPTPAIGTNFSNEKGMRVDDNHFLIARDLASLVNFEYNYISLTYVAAGNGAGEIETVTYKNGGSGGTVQGVLTLTYDTSNRISSVTRSDS